MNGFMWMCVCAFMKMSDRFTLLICFEMSKRSQNDFILFRQIKNLPYRRIHKMLYELCVCVCVINKLTCYSEPDLTVVNSFYSVSLRHFGYIATTQTQCSSFLLPFHKTFIEKNENYTVKSVFIALFVWSRWTFFPWSFWYQSHTHSSFACHTGNFVQKENRFESFNHENRIESN